MDLDNSVQTVHAARRINKVAAHLDEAKDEHVIDRARTAELRNSERAARREHAVPTMQWLAEQRSRIERRDLAPHVLRMFRESWPRRPAV
jgi:hypothetical protein